MRFGLFPESNKWDWRKHLKASLAGRTTGAEFSSSRCDTPSPRQPSGFRRFCILFIGIPLAVVFAIAHYLAYGDVVLAALVGILYWTLHVLLFFRKKKPMAQRVTSHHPCRDGLGSLRPSEPTPCPDDCDSKRFCDPSSCALESVRESNAIVEALRRAA